MIGSAVLLIQPIVLKNSAASIRIRYRGEATDNSLPFTGTVESLGTRSTTDAFVDDVPGPWKHMAYNASPDLRAIIQEIVDRPNWRSGNSLTVFVADNGSDLLRAVGSLDDKRERASILRITYWSPW